MTVQFCVQVVLGFLIWGIVASEGNQANNANNKLRGRIRRDTPPSEFDEIDFDFDGLDEIEWTRGDEGGEGEAVQQIVGGEEANLGDYPYFVDLGNCGGSLIAPDLVLTAAHCGDYRGYYVLVGAFNRGNDSTEGATFAKVTEWARHPYYDDDSAKNDFALMKIDPPVYLDADIVLTLNEEGDLREGESLKVMGLGSLEEDADDDGVGTLRDVTVKMIPTAICNGEAWYDGDIDYTMFCAGYQEGGSDSCQGDSGGPLVRVVGNQHVQVGIASWGAGCGFRQRPGVYSGINRASVQWIKQIGCTQWDSSGSFCRGSSGAQGGSGGVIGSVISCAWNEKEVDFTLLTGDDTGVIGWEIINVAKGKSVLTQMGSEKWETYQTRKCLPQSPYILLMKNYRGNG
ncbi:unnamed protein product [Cylindrotheca closterium]|uniref:Peptidase S1 domain-containing protein n=1 Tax=Cylindrotheca closterium TaxID=2856 RepID=A0AAD2GEL2_9STRA|nr:unnamed protein product [Cylindrotheca closterium]